MLMGSCGATWLIYGPLWSPNLIMEPGLHSIPFSRSLWIPGSINFEQKQVCRGKVSYRARAPYLFNEYKFIVKEWLMEPRLQNFLTGKCFIGNTRILQPLYGILIFFQVRHPIYDFILILSIMKTPGWMTFPDLAFFGPSYGHRSFEQLPWTHAFSWLFFLPAVF